MKTIIATFLFFLLIFLPYYFYNKEKSISKKYRLLGERENSFLRILFLGLSLMTLLLGLLDLNLGTKKVKNEANGLDIVFVLDVSKSMNVADLKDDYYKYSRLDIAKSMISDFVSKNIENRYGLSIFAGDAISISPLTFDTDIFLTFLSGVDYKNLSVQGSNFEKALESGLKRFGDEDRTKVIILLSDGGDDDEKINFSQIKKSFSDNNIVSFVFGIGTKAGGNIAVGRDVFGTIKYQKYNNKLVVSKLNESNLKSIAKAMGGVYFKADSLSLLSKQLSNLDKNIIELSSSKEEKVDASRILSFVSIIFFFLYLIFPILKFSKKQGK